MTYSNRERSPFFARPHEYDRNGYCWADGSRHCERADLHRRMREESAVIARDAKPGETIGAGAWRFTVAELHADGEAVVITDTDGNHHRMHSETVLRKFDA